VCENHAMTNKPRHFLVQRLGACLLAITIGLSGPAAAAQADPPYQPQLERLTRILGSLEFLHPLCGPNANDWRSEAARVIELEAPDDERRSRLVGAYNDGYEAFSRLYNRCTASARTALEKFLIEGGTIARDIELRYAQ
jgi:uncharacterized protein (TIGR02301 family)